MEPSIREVEKTEFAKLLGNYTNFTIPNFQRPYTWKAKQLADLWDSLVNNPNYYYIGTIFGIPGSRKAESNLEIIDGQQRITTLSIILIALRDFVDKNKNKFEDAEGIVQEINNLLLQKKRYSSKDQNTSKIKFSKKNIDTFYNSLVKGEYRSGLEESEIDDNQDRILKNYKKSLQLIRDYFKDSKDHNKTFEQLKDKIETLYLIIIVAKDDINAFKLFEGLNATGLPLSEVDLIKNAIFRAIYEASGDREESVEQDEAENLWVEMETDFEATKYVWFAKYLRHQWISASSYISSTDLFKKIKEEKLDSKKTSKEILSYVKSLSREAELYITLRTSDSLRISKDTTLKKIGSAKRKELEDLLFKLRMYGVDQVYAVILCLVRKFETSGGEYTESQLLRDVKRITYYTLLAKYTSVVPSQYEKIFAECCSLTNAAKKDFNKMLSGAYKELFTHVRDREEEFADSFSDEFKFKEESDTKRLIWMTLYEIYAIDYPETAHIKYSEDSTEHILSQEPIKNGLNKKQIKEHVHKIGNLTLLDRKKNGSLSNKPIEEKMKIYAEDIFAPNKNLRMYEDLFTSNYEEAIKKRGQDLGRKFYQIAISELQKL
jgi:uncharacterized protein with ParB-like and HNH nuclease domain